MQTLSFNEYLKLTNTLSALVLNETRVNTVFVTFPRGGAVLLKSVEQTLMMKDIVFVDLRKQVDYKKLNDSLCPYEAIFIVDDILDTGKTIANFLEGIESPIRNRMKMFTLHKNIHAPDLDFPHFYLEKSAEWIAYPYELGEESRHQLYEYSKQDSNPLENLSSWELVEEFRRVAPEDVPDSFVIQWHSSFQEFVRDVAFSHYFNTNYAMTSSQKQCVFI